jgi:CDP-diglyceride synthetase
VAHVAFGAVAMVTGCLQVWPWLRRTRLRMHRIAGRVYVFAGVLPAGLTALYIGVHTPFGPSVLVSNVWMAVLWLGCTALAWRAVRQRRMDDHRTWMIRSFALTMSIIVTRLLAAPTLLVLYPQLDTTFGGSEEMLMYVATSVNTWLGWTLMLVVAECFIRRRHGTRRRRRAAAGR